MMAGKTRGNVINPDEYIDRYGSDNLRAYLLFCGPWEEGGDLNDRSLNGVVRFNDRLTGYLEQGPPSGPGGVDMSRLDRAIHKIGKDIEALKFNTAIAELMSLSNWFRDDYAAMNNEEWDRTRRTFALLLAPLEPFLAEELWEQLGECESVHRQSWPSYDPQALVATTVDIPVQVDGKVRGTVTVARDADQEAVLGLAMTQPAVTDMLSGGSPRKVIYVPGRILSLVS
jgi:leucyl-tRNA synthetase